MEPKHAITSAQSGSTSLYGYDLLNVVKDYGQHMSSAYEAARYVLTHADNYPLEQAVRALGIQDRAAFDVFNDRRDLRVVPPGTPATAHRRLSLFVNTLGRLHIRPIDAPRPMYSPQDQWTDIGVVDIDEGAWHAINSSAAAATESEATAFDAVKGALDVLHGSGRLADTIELAIDSIQHIDNVCFYVDDSFYARIERYANLIDTKGGRGVLSQLPDKDYSQWTPHEVLIVSALQALFLSGGGGRFEEFNGTVLSARSLIATLNALQEVYRSVGCSMSVEPGANMFDMAADIGRQAEQVAGRPWLRYRWIYGLNFQKIERVLPSTTPSERPDAHLTEFGEVYRELVSERRPRNVPSSLFFTQLASACLTRDLAGVRCPYGSDAVTGWMEYLIERIVASAVKAVAADYGMSSSLKDFSSLLDPDDARVIETVHALKPQDFFTCFVSRDFRSRLDPELAMTIAVSVQKRMMFNRWHFIPGNLQRSDVANTRHWFYPPVVPDIAVHSNMHRAAHNRAMVKYSVRAPGPDLSRPALQLAGRPYRGFYDVRVVRMDGEPFDTEALLRARRRTLWMESLYGVLGQYLQSADAQPFVITGFEPGRYLDLPKQALHDLPPTREVAEVIALMTGRMPDRELLTASHAN